MQNINAMARLHFLTRLFFIAQKSISGKIYLHAEMVYKGNQASDI